MILIETQMQLGSLQLLLSWFREESSCLLLGMPFVLMIRLILVWKHLNIIDLGKGAPLVQTQAIVPMQITQQTLVQHKPLSLRVLL